MEMEARLIRMKNLDRTGSMLGHKHIGFENDENRDNSNYCWEKMLEYCRA